MEYNPNHVYIGPGNLSIRDARQTSENQVDDRNFKTFKLTVSTKYAKHILDNKYFYLNLRRVTATVWKPSSRCIKCLRTGHKADECEELVCKHCAGNHASYRCGNIRKKATHKCIICEREQRSNTHHRANDNECPILANEVAEATNKMIASIMVNHGQYN